MSLPIDAYRRLCCRSNPETVRKHPLTTSYAPDFFAIARDRGLREARAWLLGRLIVDLHPEGGPIPS